ncbi:unnamed protein product [Penicillium salamii]|uniref:Uncharacterized protein n=1 Tax=Penicillium salamii TaxID=1612424 RepID=A0A9W4JME9_9EURO|nr:unnamed protein product [Penicillium salamii]CAG8241919.1 unnamed protein product [Penicillium salamii]CAG8318212.1 unnamed protein product [Penicillium salamii]CAG8320978.1 unnamed protein product [Penicillium salamii]CAG8339605.1 unnamed protein product [Penicillium salamii]
MLYSLNTRHSIPSQYPPKTPKFYTQLSRFNSRILTYTFTMKFTISAIVSLLAVAVSAAPLEARQAGTVSVVLSNDQSGASGTATFQPDNTDRSIFALYGSTPVGADGTVKASSAFFNVAPVNINCVIINNGVTIATLTNDKSFADLDGNAGQATPVNLNGAIIRCHV